ncbi:hypothetical protein H0W26_03365 [Candidatus Dependentiae bacterium]|nr:hypothetical protein [Candidatus Dependentiae bacterium]
MEWLDKFREYVRNLENRDLYKNLGIFFGCLLLILAVPFYLHYRRVQRYTADLRTLDKLRAETKKIIAGQKTVTAQKEKVDELLAQNKNFRIAEAYQTIVQKLGLLPKLKDPISPTIGETISEKIEVTVTSHFTGITMKNVTDLLSQIAAAPQLYTKEVVIKKTPNAHAVDVDITVATLESSPTE